jgi:hypothetical protein
MKNLANQIAKAECQSNQLQLIWILSPLGGFTIEIYQVFIVNLKVLINKISKF